MRIQIMMSLFLILGYPAFAGTVVIEAGRDCTLLEDANGALANGTGPSLFVGRTGQSPNAIRRSLIYFDVAKALPDVAIIESASLTLYMTPSHDEPRDIRLYRLLADWGEGRSYASGGGGAPAEPGDATWIHTFYDQEFWAHPGGQYVGRVSARLEVGPPGLYTWVSNNHLLQDVRQWRSAPERNFGWILIGDETTIRSVKTFASREDPMAILRPTLTVTYRLPGKP